MSQHDQRRAEDGEWQHRGTAPAQAADSASREEDAAQDDAIQALGQAVDAKTSCD